MGIVPAYWIFNGKVHTVQGQLGLLFSAGAVDSGTKLGLWQGRKSWKVFKPLHLISRAGLVQRVSAGIAFGLQQPPGSLKEAL